MTRTLPRPPAAVEPGRGWPGSILTVPVSRRAWTENLYVLVAVPLAVLGFLVVSTTLLVGAALVVTFIGLPLLAAGGRLARWLAGVQRALARALLNEHVVPPRRFEPGHGFFGWLQAALTDGPSWRARAYLLLKYPLAVVTWYVAAVFWLQGLFWLSYPLWWQISEPGQLRSSAFLDLGAIIFRAQSADRRTLPHSITLRAGDFYFDTWPRALLVTLLGLIAVLAAPWVVHGLVWLDRLLIRSLLSRGNSARVRELEAARSQVVEDSASTLRRIERDLHDGTQAQLATLAMTLGQAKEKLQHRPEVPFDPDGALTLVDSAHRHAKEALTELRDIARGIHPPALDVGLDAALATLVARSAVPAVLHADLPTRPTQAIEAIAYFSAAELLANVAKHSRARHAVVEVSTQHATLLLSVRDDGIGGAGPGNGSGLPGLLERVRAVDGHLDVHSPQGGPTVITIRLPLHA